MTDPKAVPDVALVPSSFAPHVGGVEQLSRRLANELRARGAAPVVITNRVPKGLSASDEVDGTPVRRVRFRVPEPRARHLAGWALGAVAAHRQVRRVLVEHRSELVHVHCVSSNGRYARAASRALGLPLVVSLHGELSMDSSAVYQRSALIRREWRELLTDADVVTGCSDQVVREAVAAFGPGLADKISVVPNGVDLDVMGAVRPEPRSRPYVFAIGRLVPEKGFDLLIDAFAEVAHDFPQLDLVVAGEGPCRAALSARAGSLGTRLELVGAVPQHRAFALYKGAAAFALPSRHEPQGIVLLEAMAAGVPIVAADVGGVGETVRDGQNGLLVHGGDSVALAHGLRRLLKHPADARARVAQARSDVSDYTWSRVTDRYLACYAEALAHHGRTS